ncbi:MAG TPA: CBS domain-containing protein [Herpetosiphonaceae bacterium]
MRKVRDVMQPSVTTITPATPRAEIERQMAQRGMHHLPVLEGGAIVGMISYGDVRRARASDVPRLSISEPPSASSVAPARAMMSRPVIKVAVTAPLSRAAWLMLKHKIAGLPVLRDGRLVGIITASDILREVARPLLDEEERS